MVKQEGNYLAPLTSFYGHSSYDGPFSFGNDLRGSKNAGRQGS